MFCRFLLFVFVLTVLGCGKQSGIPVPKSQRYFENGAYEKVLAACDEELPTVMLPEGKNELRVRKGRAYLALADKNCVFNEAKSREYAQLAVDQFTTVLNHKESFEVYDYRKMAYKLLGDRDAAAKDAQKVRELDPSYNIAYVNEPVSGLSQKAKEMIARIDAEERDESDDEIENRIKDEPSTNDQLTFTDRKATENNEKEDDETESSTGLSAKMGHRSLPKKNQSITRNLVSKILPKASDNPSEGLKIDRKSLIARVPQTDVESTNKKSDSPQDNENQPEVQPTPESSTPAKPKFKTSLPFDQYVRPFRLPSAPRSKGSNSFAAPIPRQNAPQQPWINNQNVPHLQRPTTGIVGQVAKYEDLFPNRPTTGYTAPITTQPGALPNTSYIPIGSFDPSSLSTNPLPFEKPSTFQSPVPTQWQQYGTKERPAVPPSFSTGTPIPQTKSPIQVSPGPNAKLKISPQK